MTCRCGHTESDHRNYKACAAGRDGYNTVCPCVRYRNGEHPILKWFKSMADDE